MYRSIALGGCLLVTLGAGTAAAQQVPLKPRTQDSQKKPAPAARPKAAPAPLALPEGAVEIDGAWSYTDPAGKKWIYRKTPFGLAKVEDLAKPAAEQETLQKQVAQVHTAEDGDSVQFERQGPFGVYRWNKKKTELGPMEQAAWDRDRAGRSGASEKE